MMKILLEFKKVCKKNRYGGTFVLERASGFFLDRLSLR